MVPSSTFTGPVKHVVWVSWDAETDLDAWSARLFSLDVVPLVRSCGLLNSLDSIMNIDIEVFGLIVNVSQHNLAVTIEPDHIQLRVQFILDDLATSMANTAAHNSS